MQPRVLAVLQRVVTELLPQPLLQIRTCTEERGACQLQEALPGQPAGGAARLTQRALVSWVGCVPTASLPFITTELIPGNSSLQTLGLGEWEKELTERP